MQNWKLHLITARACIHFLDCGKFPPCISLHYTRLVQIWYSWIWAMQLSKVRNWQSFCQTVLFFVGFGWVHQNCDLYFHCYNHCVFLISCYVFVSILHATNSLHCSCKWRLVFLLVMCNVCCRRWIKWLLGKVWRYSMWIDCCSNVGRVPCFVFYTSSYNVDSGVSSQT